MSLRSQLAADENVLGTLTVDLDDQLRFAPGLIALTDRRLLAESAGHWSAWTLDESLSLNHFDHAGVGTLELLQKGPDGPRRLASWRFTLGANVQALRLLRLFEQRRAPVLAASDEPALCPDCDLPLPPDSEECPACARELH
ncbi:MAG: ABC transporter, partial [Comamonadaceae bacterium]